MISERAHLIEKYEGVNEQFNIHLERLKKLIEEDGLFEGGHWEYDIDGEGSESPQHPTQAFRNLAGDLLSLWNEMHRYNDQAYRRTGRYIDRHMKNIDQWRATIRGYLEQSNQSHLVPL